jgi:NADH-ubiquinone oxidoreductase chain 5
MLSFIILNNLFVFLLLFSFGRFLGKKGSHFIILFFFTFNFFLFFYYFSAFENFYLVSLFTWISFNTLFVNFTFLFDNLTFIMLFIILIISGIVHIYSFNYLEKDPHHIRFLSYLALFTFFMLLLVVSENFIIFFFAWEGVGLCSYLLINFWFSRLQANKAALKAIFYNKIGDLALLIAICLIFYLFGTLSFTTLITLIPYCINITYSIFNINFNLYILISFFLFIGVIGKSAQFGLHVWLPDAMEGPTPVSALLHAATMVTAGIFLFLRCTFFFDHCPIILKISLFVGSLTAFFAATTGFFQSDLKKIIAYSTCSQLGFMLVACGLTQYSVAFFHLFNHAFFKALLFLAAGTIIHTLQDEQDIRKMGGLAQFLPLTNTFFLIASFSLMGLPYLSGFFSKDLLLEILISYNNNVFFFFCLCLLLITTGLTAAYSMKLFGLVFYTQPNFLYCLLPKIQENVTYVQILLSFLCFLSIFSGWLFSDYFVGCGTTNFSFLFYQTPELIQHEFLLPFVKQLPLFFTICGFFFTYYLCFYCNFLFFWTNFYWYFISFFFNQKWLIDFFYNKCFLILYKKLIYFFYLFLDKGMLEFLGPMGFAFNLQYMSCQLRQIQNGNLSSYLFYIYFFFIILLIILVI